MVRADADSRLGELVDFAGICAVLQAGRPEWEGSNAESQKIRDFLKLRRNPPQHRQQRQSLTYNLLKSSNRLKNHTA